MYFFRVLMLTISLFCFVIYGLLNFLFGFFILFLFFDYYRGIECVYHVQNSTSEYFLFFLSIAWVFVMLENAR